MKKFKQDLQRKYFLELVNEFNDIIPEEEIEKLKEDFNRGSTYPYSSYIIRAYFGTSLEDDFTASSFSSEDEKLIEEDNWRKTSVIYDRIKFFKSLGIDLGDDYDSYMNDDMCRRLIPSEELINKIKKRKEYYNNKINEEYYKNLSSYKRNEQILQQENFLGNSTGHIPDIYVKKGTCICPQIKVKDEYIVHPILYYSIDSMYDWMDQKVIHELNHIYELALLEVDGTKANFKCGWDLVNDDFSEESSEYERENRPYELVNEITNELISQEITKLMHSQGTYIFNTPENAKTRGASSYETTNFLICDFINEFGKAVIESRTDSLDILYNTVGKENFDEFNKLFNIFESYFGGLNILNLYTDIEDKKQTERTEIYYKLIQQKDDIISLMKKYYEEHKYIA